MMRATVCTAMAAAALGAAGCGGKYATPTATMKTMHAAATAGDKEGIKACFSAETRKMIDEIEKVAGEFAKLHPNAADKMSQVDISAKMAESAKTAKIEYGAEKIDGDKATLEVTTNGRKGAFQFVKENGAWKIQLPITDAQLGMIKAGLELMKKTPQAVKDGLKALSGKIKKDLERDQ